MPGLEGVTLGPYHLQSKLGTGGMSEVYLAQDEEHQRPVAIKIMNSTNADYLERFRREAEAIDKLKHPHIMQALDYDEEQPWYYLVMEYIPGGTLRDRLKNGPLSPEEAGEMLNQIADALQFAHNHGILHRDIKPSNILLRDEHHAYLADFGLAKAIEGTRELTQSGALLGTPEYMAPDLAESPATKSTDIYALGAMLYQMVTGRVPFTGATPIAVYWKQLRDQPVPPSEVNPNLWAAIDDVILHALDKDPERRYQTAQQLAEAYQQALQGPREFLPAKPIASLDGESEEQKLDGISTDPQKLILPGQQVSPPVAVHSLTKRMLPTTPSVTASTLPPLPMRTPPTSSPTPPSIQPIPKPKLPSRRRRNLTTSIVGIGLLIFIGLPMSFFYYAYSQQTNKTPLGKQTTAVAQSTQDVQATQQTTTNQSAQATQQAQATAQVANDALNTPPLLIDNLSNNVAGRWSENAKSCLFTNTGYQVTANQADYLQPCSLLSTTISDITVKVDVTLLAGNNTGMLLRLTGDRFYDFEITNRSEFFFRRHDAGGGANYILLQGPTANNTILQGQKNTLQVIAKGSNFKLYINGSFVSEANDSTYQSGQFALAAGTLAPTNFGQARFSDLKMYTVP